MEVRAAEANIKKASARAASLALELAEVVTQLKPESEPTKEAITESTIAATAAAASVIPSSADAPATTTVVRFDMSVPPPASRRRLLGLLSCETTFDERARGPPPRSTRRLVGVDNDGGNGGGSGGGTRQSSLKPVAGVDSHDGGGGGGGSESTFIINPHASLPQITPLWQQSTQKRDHEDKTNIPAEMALQEQQSTQKRDHEDKTNIPTEMALQEEKRGFEEEEKSHLSTLQCTEIDAAKQQQTILSPHLPEPETGEKRVEKSEKSEVIFASGKVLPEGKVLPSALPSARERYEAGYLAGYNAAAEEAKLAIFASAQNASATASAAAAAAAAPTAPEEVKHTYSEEGSCEQALHRAAATASAALQTMREAYCRERERASLAEARAHETLLSLKTAEATATAAVARTDAAERGAEAARTWAALAARQAADEANCERAVARAATTDAAAACATALSLQSEIAEARVRADAIEKLLFEARGMSLRGEAPGMLGSGSNSESLKKGGWGGVGFLENNDKSGGRMLFAPLSMGSPEARARSERAAGARAEVLRELQALSRETGLPSSALAAVLRLPRNCSGSGAGCASEGLMREVGMLLRTLRAEGGLPLAAAFANLGWPDAPALICHCTALRVSQEGAAAAVSSSASILTRSNALNRWASVVRADASASCGDDGGGGGTL